MTHILINSRNRSNLSDDTNNFTINLQNTIYNVKSLSLKGLLIPNSIYNIDSNNNNLQWNQSGNFSYTIPSGFYTITTLLSTIQNGMNGVNSNSYVWSYNSTTLRVTATGTASFYLIFNVPNSPWRELGFTNTTTTISTSLTGVNSPNLLGNSNLYIKIDQCNNSNVSQNNEFSFWIPIYVNNGSLNYVIGDILPEQDVKVFNSTISSFNIKLFREDGLANLNGLDWSMYLEIKK